MSKILPVIHHLDDTTTLTHADLARACGADGVFLISHSGDDSGLPALANTIAGRWRQSTDTPALIGINLLNTAPTAAFGYALAHGLDAIWADAPGVSSYGASKSGQKLSDLAKAHPQVAVFASVAFKYQPDEANPPAAAREAVKLGMIPTTSGAGTGIAPTVEKIEGMSKAVNGKLAVASGMTCENVAEFAPHLSHILVATGVSKNEHEFDETLLRRFVEAVRASTSQTAEL